MFDTMRPTRQLDSALPQPPAGAPRALLAQELFPHAPAAIAMELPPRPLAPRGRVRGAASRLLNGLDATDPAGRLVAPPPAFWPVYGRQRGLASCEELWARDIVAPVLHGRGSLRYATTLHGRIGDLDVLLAAVARRPRRRNQREPAWLVLGTQLPWQAVANQRCDPSRVRRIGWNVLHGQFGAWLEVPAIAPAKGELPVPAIDEATVDWFCAQALGAATACMVGGDGLDAPLPAVGALFDQDAALPV